MTYSRTLGKDLSEWVARVGSAGRAKLWSIAASSLHFLIEGHIQKLSATRHKWADKLNASPTGFYSKAANGMSTSSDDHSATVTIAGPGFNRAIKDVTITPHSAPYLTIPFNSMSYGHRVGELRRLGWVIFRPGEKNILMGKQKASKEKPVTLYLLRKIVVQRQDRSLLPSDKAICQTVSRAMMAHILNLSKAA